MSSLIPHRREDSEKHTTVIILQRYAQFLISLLLLGGATYGALNHFATAADVDKKFRSLQTELRLSASTTQKQILEIELYKLRSSGKSDPATRAQIRRFETELENINARIRDLERRL